MAAREGSWRPVGAWLVTWALLFPHPLLAQPPQADAPGPPPPAVSAAPGARPPALAAQDPERQPPVAPEPARASPGPPSQDPTDPSASGEPVEPPTTGGTQEADEAHDEAADAVTADPLLDALSEPEERAFTRGEIELRRRQQLQARLRETNQALEDSSAFWPVAVTAFGLSTMTLGVGIGVLRSAGCGSDEVCDGANAAAGTLTIAGLGAAAAGLVWWYWKHDERRVLRSQRYKIENELQWLVVE